MKSLAYILYLPPHPSPYLQDLRNQFLHLVGLTFDIVEYRKLAHRWRLKITDMYN